MEFIFVSPNENKVFESSDFEILDNKGMVTEMQLSDMVINL